MSPRKANDQPLKEALQEMLETFRLDQKFRQKKIVSSWEKIMGPAVANRTNEIIFREKKLFVYLNSASLREELFNSRDRIMNLLNEEAGAEIVTEIVFT
jgi:predicted nucleic acid-binding Zn ribbon protein